MTPCELLLSDGTWTPALLESWHRSEFSGRFGAWVTYTAPRGHRVRMYVAAGQLRERETGPTANP